MTTMTSLYSVLFCLSIFIIKLTASPIVDETVKSNDERWFGRSKYSNDDNMLRKLFISKSAKLPSSIHSFKANTIDNRKTVPGLSPDGQAIKQMNPLIREALHKLLSKLNSDRQKLAQANSFNDEDSPKSFSPSKTVQSFYPKCEDSQLMSRTESNHNEEESNKNDENKLMNKDAKFMPLYYDLQHLPVNNADNVSKSNLRVYIKRLSHEDTCECKGDNDEDEDNQLKLSIYEIASKVTFLPLKEVSRKQPIETIKFNRCCEQLLTFDVKDLVQKWIMYPDSNNGLLLELTDYLGDKLNVDDYIHNMNCSDKTPPIPYFKIVYPDLPENLAKITGVYYPTLDVVFFNNYNPFDRIINSRQRLEDDRNDKDTNV